MMKNSILKIITCFFITISICYAESDSAVRFKDMSDREINLAEPAQRIVVIPIPAASMLIGIDESAEKLVGMHPFAGVAAQEGMLSKMFPQSLNVRTDTVGNNFTPNLETLLNVNPDLVWQWGHRGDDIIAPMVNAGLTVATLNYGQEIDTQEWIKLMGLTLGHEKKANQMIIWRQQVIEQLSQAVDKLSINKQPDVLYLSHFNSSIQTFGSTSHNNYDFKLAGGNSLNKELTGPRTLNIEQILVWNPDIILLGNFEKGLKPDDIYNHPMLSEIKAVKNNRVYKLPIGGFIWDAPNQETPLYWQWLSMIFHPNKIDIPLRNEIKIRYQQLYGYQVNDDEIDAILQLPLNKNSYNYNEMMGR